MPPIQVPDAVAAVLSCFLRYVLVSVCICWTGLSGDWFVVSFVSLRRVWRWQGREKEIRLTGEIRPTGLCCAGCGSITWNNSQPNDNKTALQRRNLAALRRQDWSAAGARARRAQVVQLARASVASQNNWLPWHVSTYMVNVVLAASSKKVVLGTKNMIIGLYKRTSTIPVWCYGL
jgi:hypothetical protein